MRQLLRIPNVPRRFGSGSHLVVFADEALPNMLSIGNKAREAERKQLEMATGTWSVQRRSIYARRRNLGPACPSLVKNAIQ